jgi:hypothetical protein
MLPTVTFKTFDTTTRRKEMKRNAPLTTAAMLFAITIFTALPTVAAAAPHCTLASAAGSWAFGYSGSIYSTQASAFVPAALMGTITFDGKGNATGRDSVAVAGTTTDEIFTGSYTENPDCSGTFTLTSQQSGQTITGKFVAADSDKEAYLIITSPGFVMTGTAKRE